MARDERIDNFLAYFADLPVRFTEREARDVLDVVTGRVPALKAILILASLDEKLRAAGIKVRQAEWGSDWEVTWPTRR